MTRIIFYVLTIGLISACGLIVEIVAGRMLAPYIGMSLYTWTAIIAVVLAGLSTGHWIGGRLADRAIWESEQLIGWVLLFSSISAAASLILLRLLSGPILNLGMSPVPTISLLTSSLFFLPSFFVGIPSPILTKLAIEQNREKTGRIVGLMYASGSLGGIVGTLAAGYIFISWLGTIYTIILVATIYVLLSAIFFTLTLKRNHIGFLVFSLIVFISIGSIYSIARSTLAFQSNCTEESDYYCIRIVDISNEVGQEARLMVLDHLGHGINLKDDPQIFQSSYIELTDLLVKNHFKNYRSIQAYFVGGGALTLPRAWSKQYPDMKIKVAEIDPTVTKLAIREMWVAKTHNLGIEDFDARFLLKANKNESYDVIIGDAFHDIAVPQHLITTEFFELVKSRLNKNGLYLMTVVDHVERPRLMLSLYKTLKQIFKNVHVWLDAEQESRVTFLLYASDKNSSAAKFESKIFQGRIWLRWSEQMIKNIESRFPPIILTDDFAPVDRLINAKQFR